MHVQWQITHHMHACAVADHSPHACMCSGRSLTTCMHVQWQITHHMHACAVADHSPHACMCSGRSLTTCMHVHCNPFRLLYNQCIHSAQKNTPRRLNLVGVFVVVACVFHNANSLWNTTHTYTHQGIFRTKSERGQINFFFFISGGGGGERVISMKLMKIRKVIIISLGEIYPFSKGKWLPYKIPEHSNMHTHTMLNFFQVMR